MLLLYWWEYRDKRDNSMAAINRRMDIDPLAHSREHLRRFRWSICFYARSLFFCRCLPTKQRFALSNDEGLCRVRLGAIQVISRLFAQINRHGKRFQHLPAISLVGWFSKTNTEWRHSFLLLYIIHCWLVEYCWILRKLQIHMPT